MINQFISDKAKYDKITRLLSGWVYTIQYLILPLSTEWNCMCKSIKIAQLWLFVDAYTDLFSFPPFVVNTYAFVSCTGV